MNIKSEKLFKVLSISIFIMYLILVVWVVIFKCNRIFSVTQGYYGLSEMSLLERALREINPIGFYIDPPVESQVPFYALDDILNVLIFIPFGLYISYFAKKYKVLKAVIFAFCISLFFEIFQLFSLLGGGSTKDLITNTFGSLIGVIIGKRLYSDSKIKMFNICSIIVLIIEVPLLMYALINTGINIDVYIGILLRTL
jgi:glycopeptide antibiotics resistance protein